MNRQSTFEDVHKNQMLSSLTDKQKRIIKLLAAGQTHENDGVTGQIGGFSIEGYKRKFKGWQPGCSCDAEAPPVPCVVLDPFGGSGTTGEIARELKRDCILIELNPEYIKIMKNRLRLNEQLVSE